jgi:predicted ArsR family transcriptional regulator
VNDRQRADRDARVLLTICTSSVPTTREIGQRVGLSPMSVYDSLRRLRARGLVAWEAGQSGTIRASVAIVAASPW